ncbi:MAG: hypothetical protein PHG15_03745 [Acinetobacter sp.]|uniref:hypothetical protein n=1 Tax=Acinetobacter sp. TaxID=472 RepID=UPI00262DDBAF|nr:hypothetical protein [Acinetobacter sp.]MDD2944925.1 hypothetical protein [Acinetobacter sp.]
MAKANSIVADLKKLADNLVLDKLSSVKSDLSQLEQFLMGRLRESNDKLIDAQIALDDVQDRFDILSDQMAEDL